MAEYFEKQMIVNSIPKEVPCEFMDEFAAGYNACVHDMERAIKTMRAADVAPVVRGYWIRHDDADIVEGYYVPEYECSKCKSWVKDDTDFCPHCGSFNCDSKMDGGKHE